MRRGLSGINALLAVDKQTGMTSHDVVAQVRRVLGERRVGHAGTLDPAASGVLIVGVGQATRLMGLLTLEYKSYLGLIAFGSETDTEDAQGTPIRTVDPPSCAYDLGQAQEIVASLVGDHEQVPPAYSAISVNGVRSYTRARAGEHVELPARPITIRQACVLGVQEVQGEPTWLCYLEVSKGCYIRSIARDLGRSLNSAAHLAELRRTSAGTITHDACCTLDELAQDGPEGLAAHMIDPVQALGLPVIQLSESQKNDVVHGRRIGVTTLAETEQLCEGDRVCMVSDSRLLGVWERTQHAIVPVANFLEGIQGVRYES